MITHHGQLLRALMSVTFSHMLAFLVLFWILCTMWKNVASYRIVIGQIKFPKTYQILERWKQ